VNPNRRRAWIRLPRRRSLWIAFLLLPAALILSVFVLWPLISALRLFL
jgi:raffinose/stachyose/melibiose transport system permease protein